MLKVDRDLKDMLDRYLARLWNEEVRLAVEQRRAASDELKDDMKEHAKANAAGRLTDKAAATWRLIVKAKRRVNADYNRIGKSRFCSSKNAPFADSQSVLEFEKAVEMAGGSCGSWGRKSLIYIAEEKNGAGGSR